MSFTWKQENAMKRILTETLIRFKIRKTYFPEGQQGNDFTTHAFLSIVLRYQREFFAFG